MTATKSSTGEVIMRCMGRMMGVVVFLAACDASEPVPISLSDLSDVVEVTDDTSLAEDTIQAVDLPDITFGDGGGDTTTDTEVATLPDIVQEGPCPAGMALIPAGTFLYGPIPQEEVLENDVCMDLTEVTVAAFNACVAADACDGYASWELCQILDDGLSPNQCFPDRDDYPANYIDWFRADAYCAWLGKRLPTPREWEKAARGEEGQTYPWGEAPLDCHHAHHSRGQIFDLCLDVDGLPNRPVSVGTYPLGISPYGLFDMLGNVKEWVDIREDLSMPMDEFTPALSRGGDFMEGEWMMTAYAVDNTLGPTLTSPGHGFRCAAKPVPDAAIP